MAEKKEKELTIKAEELAKDPAVNIVEATEVIEISSDTAIDKYGELTEEQLVSGIGVGVVSGFDNGVERATDTGVSTGIAGEKDFRGESIQRQSQEK